MTVVCSKPSPSRPSTCLSACNQPFTGCLQRNLARFIAQPSESWLRYRFPRRSEPTVKINSPPTLSPQMTHRSISPQIYWGQYSSWRELSSVQSHNNGRRSLQRNSLLKVVSWNIDFASPGPKERIAVAMEYLQRTFGNYPGQLAIILQEVCQRSVQQILETRWVQQNFVVSGHEPHQIFEAGISRPSRYFTLMMTPRILRLENSFRMPLPSEMGRDALCVDIKLCPTNTNQRPKSEMKDVLRHCTTHLESLEEGTSVRTRQLELISQNLNEGRDTTNVIASLVRGDMNAIHDTEHTMHKQMGLKDAWDDALLMHPTNSECGEENPLYGRISGHTWGYQSNVTRWMPNRLDKFMYTGCIETVSFSNIQRLGGRIGRLGIGLTADVPLKEGPMGLQAQELEIKTQKAWVSDHFGIAVGIKVVI